jgi:C4-dicarboxylate-specific signal transduction histidine kinase
MDVQTVCIMLLGIVMILTVAICACSRRKARVTSEFKNIPAIQQNTKRQEFFVKESTYEQGQRLERELQEIAEQEERERIQSMKLKNYGSCRSHFCDSDNSNYRIDRFDN